MPSTKSHSTATKPTQVWDERVRKTPVSHARTNRPDVVSVVSSTYAGEFTPVKMIPVLREDGVNSSSVRVNFRMSELSNMILNPVRASAVAYFVPKMALPRFSDMGMIDRSYNGIAEKDGSPVPWFEEIAYDPTNIFWKRLGIHAPLGAMVNDDYIQSYNAVWNYIARNRSAAIEERNYTKTTLAPAFWEHTQMKHVVPTFDDAMMDGAIPLTFVGDSNLLPVKGIGHLASQTGAFTPGSVLVNESDGTGRQYAKEATSSYYRMEEDPNNPGYPAIFAELQNNQIFTSLADIDQARETTAWARMRQQFQGLPEEYLMDQLLAGMRIADAGLNDPILMDHADTVFGMNERYAMDGANLTDSVVDGSTSVTLNLRLPPVACGGTIVICAQVLPEQVYERQRDEFLRTTTVEALPFRTRDELDPQPVDMTPNGRVDETHTAPNDLFGYEPLNAKWIRNAPNVGGIYFEPDPNAAWSENRNRIWDTNVVDPALGPDFYTATQINHDVFADQTQEPFEVWAMGEVVINGLTYFGPKLTESLGQYDKVSAQIKSGRLVGDGTDNPASPPADPE